MFGRRKDDMIDEMSDTFVDEMDVDRVDETKKFGSRGYFGKEKYDKKDDHLCEDGHSHDSYDAYESSSPAYYDETRYEEARRRADRELEKSSAGKHLCDDGEHRDDKKHDASVKNDYAPKYSASDFRPMDESIPDGSFNPDGGTNSSIPGSSESGISGNDVSGPAAESLHEAMAKSAEILYGKKTADSAPRPDIFTTPHSDSGSTTDSNAAIKMVFILMIIIGMCSGLFPLAILGVILLLKLKKNTPTGLSFEKAMKEVSPETSSNAGKLVVAAVVAFVIITAIIMISRLLPFYAELSEVFDVCSIINT